jgi:hypothetical protein
LSQKTEQRLQELAAVSLKGAWIAMFLFGVEHEQKKEHQSR